MGNRSRSAEAAIATTFPSSGPPTPHDRIDVRIAELAPGHPLGDFPAFTWHALASFLPADLTGWTALDVGCNAGFYTFELARRGATVLGLDTDEQYLRQARWAAKEYGLEKRVRYERLHVYDLARRDEQFDLVLFFGVLDHLRHPLLALDILAARTTALLAVQTLTMPGDDVITVEADLPIAEREAMLQLGWPKLAFVEHRLGDDPTSWWAPNHACVAAMLRSCGLELVLRPGRGLYVCRPGMLPVPVQRELDAATGR